jgi:hypothetical protein
LLLMQTYTLILNATDGNPCMNIQLSPPDHPKRPRNQQRCPPDTQHSIKISRFSHNTGCIPLPSDDYNDCDIPHPPTCDISHLMQELFQQKQRLLDQPRRRRVGPHHTQQPTKIQQRRDSNQTTSDTSEPISYTPDNELGVFAQFQLGVVCSFASSG